MSFLEIALRNAARGWHVHPLKPGDKTPITPHGKNDAATDAEQIRAWWTQVPTANIGIACGPSGLAVLDIDAGLNTYEEFEAWRIASGLPESYMVRTGRRPGFGVQMYFLGPMPDVGLWKLNGCSGQIKSLGGYVCAAGCLHPSGATYEVLRDAPLAPAPDVVRALRTVTPAVSTEPGAPFVKIAEGAGRHSDMTSQAGKLRHTFRVGEAELLAMMVPLNDARYAVPLPYEDLEHIAHSIGTKELAAPEPRLIIGKPPAPPDPSLLSEEAPRPVYPDDVWVGTIYGEFGHIVCRDNFIPLKFVVESFRVLTGALVGNQVTCGMAGVRMREYFVGIGHPQSGKSYGKDIAVMFYVQQSPSFVFDPLLFYGNANPYRAQGIGAQQFLPGSPNSFADDLNRKPKDPKAPKGEPSIVIDIDTGDKWAPYARLITIQGEALSLLARFGNEWVGAALSALVTDLYDGDEAEVAVTSERGSTKQAVRLQYSMMLYTQPGTWRKYMAEGVTDSGLFGRFYIVGSEQRPTQVPLCDYPQNPALFQQHFGDLRRDVFSRIHSLANTEMVMQVAPEARKKITEWLGTIPTGKDSVDRVSRMGLHVYRAALARAWGAKQQRTVISAEDADAAILLGEYQIKQREYYAPVVGDDKRAKSLNLVRQTIRLKRKLSLRDLRGQVHAERFSEQFEWSMKWLESHGEIVVVKEGRSIMVSWVNSDTEYDGKRVGLTQD